MWSSKAHIRLLSVALIAVLTGTSAVAQSIIYVNHAATGADNGTSWTNAYIFLQDALQAAQTGDEVWVAAGIYRPDQGTGIAPGDREASFEIPSGVSLYGGFSGTETALDQRIWEQNETVLSGDLLGNDDDILAYNNPTRLDNANNIVLIQDVTQNTRLDGFTITSSSAEPQSSVIYVGGNVSGQTTRVFIANCHITKNTTLNGAVRAFAGSDRLDPVVVITDTQFIQNKGINVFVRGPTTLVENVLFADVTSPGAMTALYIIDETVYLVGSTISNNYAGILIHFGSSSNGVLYMWNNLIVGNYGGSPYVEIFEGELVSVNNVFSGNTSPSVEYAGGAMYLNGAKAQIINNVFAFNSIGGTGGAIHNLDSDVEISNSIFYQNDSPNDPDIGNAFPDHGSTRISHSILQFPLPSHVTDTGGLAFGDPLFADADGRDNIPGTIDDDFRLMTISSAIDAGANDSLFADLWDLDGDGDSDEPWPTDILNNMRIFDGGSGTATVDIGAYEYGAPPIVLANDPAVDVLPETAMLLGNYPNPFNPSTTITYSLPRPSSVRLEVFDLLGKRVRILDEGFKPSGEHEATFDASGLSSGIYFYTLTADNFTQTRKMVVVK